MEALRHAGITATYCSKKDHDLLTVLKEPTELIVVAGGDGTIEEVLQVMPDREVPVALLPVGTANNIAGFLGIEGDPLKIPATWRDGHMAPLEIGAACGSWGRRLFVESVGLGALATATANADEADAKKEADPIKAGRKHLRKVLQKMEPKQMAVTIDGRALEDELLMLEVMNLGRMGPRLTFAPKADPGDGLLDVVYLTLDKRDAMLDWLKKPENGEDAPVTVERGRVVTLKWDGSDFRIGDYFPAVSDRVETVTVELEPERAKILMPPALETRKKAKSAKPKKKPKQKDDGKDRGETAALPDRLLQEIQQTANELARLAGSEIVAKLGGLLSVRYKGAGEETTWRDPVSEVDHNVEVLIRAKLAERFPDHDILGEELDERPGRDQDFVWAIDPIDGTANFINGFPLFSASIGVLHKGEPVVGALWCSTSHALRAGVYHARQGGRLHFEEQPLEVKLNPAIRRRLAGAPKTSAPHDLPWENRVTGSAAIECAFVAAGLLRVARFQLPNVWDVAGGLALVQAAGGEVRALEEGVWRPMERFEAVTGEAAKGSDLRNWRRPLILGESEAVALLCEAHTGG